MTISSKPRFNKGVQQHLELLFALSAFYLEKLEYLKTQKEIHPAKKKQKAK